MKKNYSDFLGRLDSHIENHTEKKICTYLKNEANGELSLTYSELIRGAGGVAAYLRRSGKRGKRVILCFHQDVSFIKAFLGCLYAGDIAVPMFFPGKTVVDRRFGAIAKDCGPDLVLTTQEILDRARKEPGFGNVPFMLSWTALESLPPELPQSRDVGNDDLAFLQYSSGSRFAPRGVMISHANITGNMPLLCDAFNIDDTSVGVSWLPHYLDMGLVGMILAPLYFSAPFVVMSPFSFLRKPALWLDAISRFRGTFSCAPNGAYDLCSDRITEEDTLSIDLCSWRRAINGAENVCSSTMERFSRRFAPRGFDPAAFSPAYGLAEATLGVSFHESPPAFSVMDTDCGEPGSKRRQVVGCGKINSYVDISIVDPLSLEESKNGETGEIWIKGPGVAQGYWGKTDETSKKFHGYTRCKTGPYLRTGDLGVVRDNELFITGRIKDLFIYYGQNYYPEDIEEITRNVFRESGIGLRLVTAFSVERSGSERLVVIIGTDARLPLGEHERMASLVERTLLSELEIKPHFLGFIESGEERNAETDRKRYREFFLRNELTCSWTLDRDRESAESRRFSMDEFAGFDPGKQREYVTGLLLSVLDSGHSIARSGSVGGIRVSSLGISSIEALTLAMEIEKTFGARIPMTLLLDDRPIDELVDTIISLVQRVEAGGDERVVRENESYPLSHGQKALWTIYRMAPESPSYNLGGAVKIKSELDVERFSESIERLMKAHSVLRTTFHSVKGIPAQRIESEISFTDEVFATIDGAAFSEEELERCIEREMLRPFDLECGPLARFRLVLRAGRPSILILSVHHIVTDFWSVALFFKDIFLIYDGIDQPAGNNFIKYVFYEKQWLSSPDAGKAKQFWELELEGSLPVLRLPQDHERPPIQTYRGDSINFTIDCDLSNKIAELARSKGVTLFTVLLSAYFVLLYKYANQTDIIVGIPASGRNRAEFQSSTGYFLNSLAVRSRIREEMSFSELLRNMKSKMLGILRNREYPFALLVENLAKERDFSRSPVFQTFFVFQEPQYDGCDELVALATGSASPGFSIGSVELETIGFQNKISQFDLTLMLGKIREKIFCQFKYNTDIFARHSVENLSSSFVEILSGIAAHPEAPIRELGIVPDEMRRYLLDELNDTDTDFPDMACLHTLFERQAKIFPDRIALVYEERRITFGRLNERANMIASHLIGKRIKPGTFVGLYFDRSIEIVEAIFGALKAGCVYVSIETTIPDERKKYIIDKTEINFILSVRRLEKSHRESDAEWIYIDEMEIRSDPDLNNPGIELSLDDLAYILYTSGSTGNPKAVVVSHKSIVNYLFGFIRNTKPYPGMTYGLVSTMTGDLCLSILFPPFITGGCLHIVSEDTRKDPQALIRYLEQNPIECMKFMPSHFNSLASSAMFLDNFHCKKLVFGAETLIRDLVENVAVRNPGMEIYNHYGPTETTVGVLMHKYDPERDYGASNTIPIGRPLANVRLYILDEEYEPLPPGVAGDLYVSGVCLARGYYGDQELTAGKFVFNPYGKGSHARMYKTGDIVRYEADGSVEFIERKDNQIKIKGYRVELLEIENTLKQHENILEAAVIAREDAPTSDYYRSRAKKILAYIRPRDKGSLDIRELKHFIGRKLPEYMIPFGFVLMEEFPLLPNGKIARNALPDFELNPEDLPREYKAPESALEDVLHEIWRGYLGLGKIGVHDNFFELGGNSLMATQIVGQLGEYFRTREPLISMFFNNPTIHGFACAFTKSSPDADISEIARTIREVSLMSDDEIESVLEGEKS